MTVSAHIPDGMTEAAARQEYALALDRVGKAGQAIIRQHLEEGLRHPEEATGRLAASVEQDPPQTSPQDLTKTIGSNAPQARIHETGGVILPVAAGALHFFIGGREIFARSVTEPAQPYFLPSMEAIRQIMQSEAEGVIMRSLSGL